MRASETFWTWVRAPQACLVIPGVVAGILLLSCGSAVAQASDRQEEQLRRLRLQVQQLQQQVQAAQDEARRASAEGAKAEQDAQQAQSQLGAVRSTLARSSAKERALEASLQALRTEHEGLQREASGLRSQLQEARDGVARRSEALQASEAAGQARQRELQTLTEARDRALVDVFHCSVHNHSLLGLNERLLERLLRTGLWDRVSASEPLLQLGRVQLENLAQTYRQQAARATFVPGSVASRPEGTSAGERPAP